MGDPERVIVGFTGSRRGMTDAQRVAFRAVLQALGPSLFVHGDCVGADADAHAIARDEGVVVHIRPCDFSNMRAHCLGAARTHPTTTAFARNRAIVDGCDVLIATPPTADEQPRGGTWYTIRYARKRLRRAVILAPDGARQDTGGGVAHG